AVAASALVGSDGVNRLLLLRAERQELGEAAVRRLQDNAALRAEIARLRSDPKYLEALARERLGLVRPDGMVYRFLGADAPRRGSAPRGSGLRLRGRLLLAGRILRVLVEAHQVFELRLVSHLDLDEPALVQGALVHQPGVIFELAIDRRDRAAEGRDELRDRAHRFDLPERLALLYVVT